MIVGVAMDVLVIMVGSTRAVIATIQVRFSAYVVHGDVKLIEHQKHSASLYSDQWKIDDNTNSST